MNFRSEEYFQASVERMRQARMIHAGGNSYALAMYCGGLAVESLLRAFRWKKDPSFEGRHDLTELLKASNLIGINESWMERKGFTEEEISHENLQLKAAASTVIALWNNNLRFAPEKRLRSFLKRIGRLYGAKGDPVKKNATELILAAQRIIDLGVVLWDSKKK